MARFKIGQRVLCITNQEEYIVEGFTCCPGCGDPCIYLKGMNEICNNNCGVSATSKANGCGFRAFGVREYYAQSIFVPLANISDAIQYKLKVSIPELTEIKETQLQ